MRQLLIPILAGLALAACQRGDVDQQAGVDGTGAAPPSMDAGAVGTVAVDNAGAAEGPVTPTLSGGMAGQTPAYGQPGGAPSVVYSQKDGAGPSVGNDNAPLPNR